MILRLSLSFLLLLLCVPFNAEALIDGTIYPQNDLDPPQLSAPYDLRDRHTYIQVTNTENLNVRIHVQIFQNDKNCDELNFFDELTPNDTVVYNLDNLIRNNGTPVPVNLADDSFGYVVVSDENIAAPSTLIGNFRIIDLPGNYEYRSNMAGAGLNGDPVPEFFLNSGDKFIANFNTVDGANQADVIGYAYDDAQTSTVVNYDDGVSFDIFVFDMNEEPLSCDQKVFACGGTMNYGINEDYPNSRDGEPLCPGGGLADPLGGFISLENPVFINRMQPGFEVFVGLIGINNGNGTGSMDSWFLVDIPAMF